MGSLVSATAAAPPSAIGFYSLTPCRVADTRSSSGPYGGPALSATTDRSFIFTGRCGIPSTADAVTLNVTVTGATAGGDLRIYPQGSQLPMSSSINYAPAATRANNATCGLGSTGGLSVHVDQPSGTVHMILDVSGYYETGAAPPPPPPPPAGWSKRYGDVSDDRGHAVAVDSQGNVAVTGHFDGTTDFGGGSVASYTHPSLGPTRDIFIAEYAASGAHLWSRTLGGDSEEEGNSVAVDTSGNVLLTGYQLSYGVDYGGGAQYVRGGSDIFIAKYSSAGSWVWSRTVGGYGYDSGNGIAADLAGNAIVTGGMDVSSIGVNFGGGALYSAGFSDVFLVKYSATGAHLWSQRFGGTSSESGAAVAVDSAGSIFVAGSFEGAVNFGGGTLTSAGAKDVFVAKFSSSGTHVWSKRFGGSGYDYAGGVAVDSAGDVVVTGKFQNSINFGGSALTSAGGDDAYLAKLSGSTGGHVWSKRFGSTSGDNGAGVAVDGNNNVAVTGHFLGAVDFGGGALTSVNTDVFAAKYTSAGAHLWSRKYGGTGNQFGAGVAMKGTGDVSVTGFFASTVDFGTGTLTSAGVNDACLASIGP